VIRKLHLLKIKLIISAYFKKAHMCHLIANALSQLTVFIGCFYRLFLLAVFSDRFL